MAVRVGDVSLRTLESDNQAYAHYNCADVRNDPVDVVLCGPSVN